MIFVYVLLAALLIISLINAAFTFWIYSTNKGTTQKPLISVLIPARNEERYLKNTLKSLKNLNYNNLEILVLDDNSSDKTPEIIKKSKIATYIPGKKLPNNENWTGKNWACHQLAGKARGEYFLFLDADAELEPNSLEKSLGIMKKHNLGLLSIFPTQKMKSIGEWLSVPLMNLYLLSLLPLPLVLFTNSSIFASANGQFLLFKKNTYKKIGGHKSVKSNIVEDNALAKLVKKSQFRVLTIPDREIVSCRMYSSLKEGIVGFTKNFQTVLTNSIILFSLFSIIYISLLSTFLITPLTAGLIILIRCIVSLTSRQNPLLNIIFHPFQVIIFTIICIRAILFNLNLLETEWKGRKISF